MGNLCSTPQTHSPRGSRRFGEPALRPVGLRPPGAELNGTYAYAAPAYSAAGPQQLPRPTALQMPPEMQQRPQTAAQQQVSTPTTTTSTTTTKDNATSEVQGGQLEVALVQGTVSVRAPIAEEAPEPEMAAAEEDGGYEYHLEMPINWKKGKLIGAGAFGRVFQALNNDTGQIMAVKQVTLTKDEALKGRVAEHIKALEAEVAVLRGLDHPNIVRYLRTERCDDTLNIFLEYVPGGSIASLIDKFGPLTENVVRKYTQQILKGLEYLHQRKIMHRDIKGANILVDGDGIVKLADFGASKKIEDLATVGSGSKSIRGTPYWMAPEVIKQTGHGRPADIWSLGCVVIEMATGKPPWSNCHTQVAAMFHIASTKEPPPLPEHLSPEAKDFLLLCFNRVPKERPNATRLLRHPWMANMPAHPGSASTTSSGAQAANLLASTATAPSAAANASRAPQQRHPLVPMLPLQNALSPPSPIKEEPETARSAAAAAAAAAAPAPQAQARPPVPAPVAPAPVPHTMGPLEQGRRQLMPQTAASMAMSSGLPPLAPVARSSVAQPAAVAAAPAPAPAAAAAPPRIMPPLGQPPQEQYDTIVSPSQIPAALLAAAGAGAQAPAAAEPAQEASAPAAAQPVVVQEPVAEDLSASSAHAGHAVRASMLTLDYNPMEEPSWMPNSAVKNALTAIREAAAMKEAPAAAAASVGSPRATKGYTLVDSPRPRGGNGTPRSARQRDQQAPSEAAKAADPQDTVGETDQPAVPAPALHHSASSGSVSGGVAAPVPAAVPRGAGAQQGAADADVDVADPVRQSKMQKWKDELFLELENKRLEHRQAVARSMQVAAGEQAAQ